MGEGLSLGATAPAPVEQGLSWGSSVSFSCLCCDIHVTRYHITVLQE